MVTEVVKCHVRSNQISNARNYICDRFEGRVYTATTD